MISPARLLACVVLLVGLAAVSDVQAQSMYARAYGNGYGFGLGFDPMQCNQVPPFVVGNFGNIRPAEEPPYFAKFPPVYYSHIIPRPYGISPYAVPPGIVPSEYMVPPPQREVIKNPYVDQPEVSEGEVPGQNAPMIEKPADK